MVPLAVIVGGGSGVVLVGVVVILFILCGRRRGRPGPKDKAAEAGAVVVEKGSIGAVGGTGGGVGLLGGGSKNGEPMGTAMKVMSPSILPHDNHSLGQVSNNSQFYSVVGSLAAKTRLPCSSLAQTKCSVDIHPQVLLLT